MRRNDERLIVIMLTRCCKAFSLRLYLKLNENISYLVLFFFFPLLLFFVARRSIAIAARENAQKSKILASFRFAPWQKYKQYRANIYWELNTWFGAREEDCEPMVYGIGELKSVCEIWFRTWFLSFNNDEDANCSFLQQTIGTKIRN